MNTTQLRKHYDKLTPRERLAALIEAQARDDDAEIIALGQSAPMKSYTVVHHLFLEEAWRRISDIYLIQMLNYGCAFYMGQGLAFTLEHKEGPEERREMLFQQLQQIANIITRDAAAWRKFCEKVGIDPDKSLLNLPGSGFYSPDAPLKSGMDTLPVMLRAAEALASKEPDPAEVEEIAAFYQKVLYERAGLQSGGWG